MQTCNPSRWEAEAGRSWAQGQPDYVRGDPVSEEWTKVPSRTRVTLAHCIVWKKSAEKSKMSARGWDLKSLHMTDAVGPLLFLFFHSTRHISSGIYKSRLPLCIQEYSSADFSECSLSVFQALLVHLKKNHLLYNSAARRKSQNQRYCCERRNNHSYCLVSASSIPSRSEGFICATLSDFHGDLMRQAL